MTSESTRIVSAAVERPAACIVVEWADGHFSRYPYTHLRRSCPCATCRAERDRERRDTNPFRVLPALAGPAQTELVGVEEVGRYGVRLRWGDGHDHGIYSREYLREICPCPECTAVRQEEGPFVHGLHIPG